MTAIPVSAVRNVRSNAMSRPDETRGAAIPPAGTCSAVVIERDGRAARIISEGAADAIVDTARIAFGCLIQPEPGDRVLTAAADGTVWIIAVLDRQSDAPPRLWAEGSIDIVSARGDISLTAGRAVEIGAGSRTRLAAPELELHAGVARFVLDELIHVGQRINWYVSKLRCVGEMVETFADHVLTRVKRSSRFVEESDHLRAGDIDHRAQGTLQLRGEVAFVTADTVVRVDAEQIHMG